MSMGAGQFEGSARPVRVCIAGFGTIGQALGQRIAAGDVPGMALTAVAARDMEKATAVARTCDPAPAVVPLDVLPEHADVIIECAPAAAFRPIAEPAIDAGRTLVTLSGGALLDHWDLVARAEAAGARIVVPTGALLGLDAVNAVALGPVQSIRMVTRKPPAGLASAPYLVSHGIAVESVTEPLKVFDGTARDAVKGFPANVNVAAALSLAGIGPDRTMIEIWADPTVVRNTHTITVVADASNFTMTIENVPTVENPRTGKITALSALATLRRMTATLVVGT